ncbi:MAG: tetratricopeptide repeat protein [Myxococcota bacterium]
MQRHVVTGRVLPEEPVLQYAISLNEGEFDEAEAVLDRSESQLPVILVELYRQEISRARAEAADVYRRQALEAYRSKRFEEAESYAAEAIAIEDPGGDMLFLLAQSLRLSGKRNDAAPHYRSFFEKYPDDEKADDAMYWRSESLARLGQYDEAKELLENIMALTRSNMKRQATKLLLELP